MLQTNVYYPIKTSQVVLGANIMFHMFLLVFWATNSIVDGFAYYDAIPPASFHAISHIGFWLAIEIFVLFIGAISVYFGIKAAEYGIVFAIKHTLKLMTFWTFLVWVAIAANIIHLVASCLELSDCKSTLCMKNNGFLIGLIVLLGTLIFVEFCELYGIHIYKKRLRESRPILIAAVAKKIT